METVYTVTMAWNGDSPDGSSTADVRVFAHLDEARSYYEHARRNYAGRDYIGLWSTEAPNGDPPDDEYPETGWLLSYAAPGEEDKEFDEEDEVGISFRAHPLIDGSYKVPS